MIYILKYQIILVVDGLHSRKFTRNRSTPCHQPHTYWRRTSWSFRCKHILRSWKYLLIHIELPDRATTPNLHYWYLFLSSFSPLLLKKWVETAPVAEVKEEVKVEKKEVKDENEVDLFGDDEPAEPVVEKPKPKV